MIPRPVSRALEAVAALWLVAALGACGGRITNSSSEGGGGGQIGSCEPDPSVVGCATGNGYSCPAGDAPPDAADSSLICSAPIADGSEDLYCCIVDMNSFVACSYDSSLEAACAGQAPSSFGYTCPPGVSPMTDDASFVCVALLAAGDPDGFCCSTVTGSSGGGGVGNSCEPDPSVTGCAAGDGYSCAGGDPAPSATDTSLLCSAPSSDGPVDEYCCLAAPAFPTDTCSSDPSLDSACPDPNSFGFTCMGASTPDGIDPSLTCSPNEGTGEFCCVTM